MAIAFLSTELNQYEEGWRQLLPAGHFRAKDGRPFDVESGWFIDRNIAESLIRSVALNHQDVMLDYEHQSLRAESNGQPAPASGWFNQTELKWVDGKGLYIRPRWTDNARAMLDNKEYRYLSAVFHYNTQGHPTKLISAALTNDPALTGMDELTKVAALKVAYLSTKGEHSMNEYLLKLLAVLGLEATEENIAEVTDKAVEKINELIANGEKAKNAEETIADLKSKQLDPLLFVPRAAFDELQQKVAVLSNQSNASQIDSLIEKGRKEGRVMAAEVDNLKAIGKTHGIAALSTMINARAPIAALTSDTQVIDEATQAVERVLTDEEKEAARMLGITEADYLKILLEQGEQ